MKTLKKCRAEFLEAGDCLILNHERWEVRQIEDEQYGREVRLRNHFGESKIKFLSFGEIVSIEL